MASAVRVIPPDAGTDRGDPTGMTAEKMCQSPKRDSWVTTVLVDEVMSDGDEDSMPCFLQLKGRKVLIYKELRFLNFYKSKGG